MSKKKVFLESCLLFLSKIFQRYNIFVFNRCYFLFSLHDIWWFIILFWHWLLKTLSGKNKKDRNVASSLSAKQVLLLSYSFSFTFPLINKSSGFFLLSPFLSFSSCSTSILDFSLSFSLQFITLLSFSCYLFLACYCFCHIVNYVFTPTKYINYFQCDNFLTLSLFVIGHFKF